MTVRPILVFGAGGRVGSALMPLSDRFVGLDRDNLDLAKYDEIEPLIAAANPAAIINLAACTLPRAEIEQEEAFAINTRAVSWMAAGGVPLIHVSTECVFDGESAEPYTPECKPNPISWYGKTKHFGEQELQAQRMAFVAMGEPPPSSIIIRTCGVYLRGKPNFLETVLAKAQAGEPMDVVSDTLYTPTDARELACAILTATERVIEDASVSGTYHFAGPDAMSYLDFARMVQDAAGIGSPLKPVTLAEREAIEGVRRPRNGTLNSDKFASVFGYRHGPTRECLAELINPAQTVRTR